MIIGLAWGSQAEPYRWPCRERSNPIYRLWTLRQMVPRPSPSRPPVASWRPHAGAWLSSPIGPCFLPIKPCRPQAIGLEWHSGLGLSTPSYCLRRALFAWSCASPPRKNSASPHLKPASNPLNTPSFASYRHNHNYCWHYFVDDQGLLLISYIILG